MTQAFNLSQLANNLNSSGQLDATDGLAGLVPLANGGTGATNTVNAITAGSGITTSVSGQTVTINATGSGTVTSVATGNGLQGGTITGSGTLSIAAPGFNTVGSYVFGQSRTNGSAYVPSSGSNFSTGNDYGQVAAGIIGRLSDGSYFQGGMNTLSGTWRSMGYGNQTAGEPNAFYVMIFCRVS